MDPLTCAAVEPLLVASRPLSPEEAGRLQAHLGGCPACRAVQAVAGALASYAASPATEADQARARGRLEASLRRARWRPWLALSPLAQAPVLAWLLCSVGGASWDRVGVPVLASGVALTLAFGGLLWRERARLVAEAGWAERQGLVGALASLEVDRATARLREQRLGFAALGGLTALTAAVPGLPPLASGLLGGLALAVLGAAAWAHLRLVRSPR